MMLCDVVIDKVAFCVVSPPVIYGHSGLCVCLFYVVMCWGGWFMVVVASSIIYFWRSTIQRGQYCEARHNIEFCCGSPVLPLGLLFMFNGSSRKECLHHHGHRRLISWLPTIIACFLRARVPSCRDRHRCCHLHYAATHNYWRWSTANNGDHPSPTD